MRFTVHHPGQRPRPLNAPPPPGQQWVCRDCGAPCRVTHQDTGPWLGQEHYYEWRSDCCSALYDEGEMEG